MRHLHSCYARCRNRCTLLLGECRHVSDLFLDPRNQSNPDFLLIAKCSFLMTNLSTHTLEGSMYLFRDPALSLLMSPLSSASPALLFLSTIYKHISLLFKKKKRQLTSPGWMHETSARAWCTGKTQRNWLGGTREGGSGWGIHVTPWLIRVNVWRNPLQYCKVIGLQLIKINGKKKINKTLKINK